MRILIINRKPIPTTLFLGRRSAKARGSRFSAMLALLLASSSLTLVDASSAWACSNQGQSAGGYNYSSQLSSSAILVCNSNLVTKTTPPSVSTSSKTVVSCTTTKQVIFTGPPSFATKQVNLTVCGSSVIVKNLAPPSPAVVTSAANSSSPGSTSNAQSAAQASFSPDPISVTSNDSVVEPNLPVTFEAVTSVHFRTGTLLGQAVTVRFTPTLISWDFGLGPQPLSDFASQAAITHAFSDTGSQLVAATVRFAAAYRFAGQTTWTTESGYLAKTDSVTVIIARKPPPPAPAKPIAKPKIRLVAQDCIANPNGRGCP